MSDGCDLDTLLDVLSDDEDLDGDLEELNSDNELTQEQQEGTINHTETVETNIDENNGEESPENNEANEEEEEIRKQLAAMEEQMRLMKEKLKKPKGGSDSSTPGKREGSGSETPKDKGIASKESREIGEKSKFTSGSKPTNSKVSSSNEKKMKEVDLFSSPGTNSKSDRKLKSPVKTQPLKENERDFKTAKYEAKTTEWCPSLIRKDSSRVLTGEEADKLKASLAAADRQRMESVARQDLMDSSDDEKDEEGNSVLSDYGRELKQALSQKQRVSRVAPVSEEKKSPTTSRVAVVEQGSTSAQHAQARANERAALLKAKEKDKQKAEKSNYYVERNSGLRISRPLISQVQINSAMKDRRMVQLSRIAESIARKETNGDWVTIGVLYYKTPIKKSNSGNEYSIWKLTDLKGEIKTVTLFLFGQAHKNHWKLSLNKVIGVLNPKIMEERQVAGAAGSSQNKAGEVTICIDHPDKLLEMGDSLDIARCAFLKPDKTNCANIVNKSLCEFCTYHVKKAYKAVSAGRSGLQSSFSGLSSEATRNRLMAKVAPLSKGEVFGGGRLMNASGIASMGSGGGGGRMVNQPVGRKSNEEKARDARLVASLGSGDRLSKELSELPNKQPNRNLPSTLKFLNKQERQAIRNVAKNESEELAMRLLAPSLGARNMLAGLVSQQQKQDKSYVAQQQKSARDLLIDHSKALSRGGTPKLGRGLNQGGMVNIDLSPAIKSNYSASHSRALAILQNKNKKLVAEDPNKTHKKDPLVTPERVEKMKRRIERSSTEDENETNSPGTSKTPQSKKIKLDEQSPKTVRVFGREMTQEELDKLRSTKSRNQHLVAEAELEATDKYFDTMEKRDEMEEKMLSTFEMKTKAVTCHECNYTSFKASDICKSQGHKYKVIDAVKRFYSCKKCKKRVTCLTRLPKEACKQCGESNWVRAGMIAERKGPALLRDTLSVRGNEEKWLGGSISSVNIDI